MSRRPATCIQPLVLAATSILVLAGCGSSSHEAPAPPPIAASSVAARPSTTNGETLAESSPTPADGPDAKVPPDNAELAGSTQPPSTADANAKAAEKPVDALQWMRDGEARKTDYARRLQEAQFAVDAAKASVSERESILLAFKNPYRPRPQLTPQDAQAVEGMGGAERVRWAEDRLAAANVALDLATKKLEDVKANPPLN